MIVNFKKIFLSSLGVFALVNIAGSVNAETLEYGDIQKSGNTVTVPIILNVIEEEEVKNVSFSCYSSDADVTCEINAVSPTTAKMSGNVATFAYYNPDEEIQSNLFKSGKTTIANIVYTNNEYSQKNFEFGISDSTYTLDRKSITVAAKQVERVVSTDARLGSVTVTQGTISPDFNPDVTEYTIYNIADTVNSIKFSLKCNDGDTCSFDYPTGGKSTNGYTVSLNQGENAVSITSHSEDGNNSVTYKFNVIRGESAFNSAKLKKIEISDYTLAPSFSKDVLEYNLTVPNTVNSLINNLSYEAEDKNANVVTAGLDNFVEGENKLTLTVTNASGDEERVYVITVKRMSKEDIEVIGYKNGIVTFKDSEGNTKTLEEAEFKNFYVEEYNKIINKTYKFDEDGNIVIESNEVKQEEVVEEKKKNNIIPIVLIVVIGLSVIVISGVLIFRKKKTPEESENIEMPVPKEIDETGIEEEIIGQKEVKVTTNTMDVDEALNDLMSTKNYDFKDGE